MINSWNLNLAIFLLLAQSSIHWSLFLLCAGPGCSFWHIFNIFQNTEMHKTSSGKFLWAAFPSVCFHQAIRRSKQNDLKDLGIFEFLYSARGCEIYMIIWHFFDISSDTIYIYIYKPYKNSPIFQLRNFVVFHQVRYKISISHQASTIATTGNFIKVRHTSSKGVLFKKNQQNTLHLSQSWQ